MRTVSITFFSGLKVALIMIRNIVIGIRSRVRLIEFNILGVRRIVDYLHTLILIRRTVWAFGVSSAKIVHL